MNAKVNRNPRGVPCPMGSACPTVGKKHQAGSRVLQEHTAMARERAERSSDLAVSSDSAPRPVSRDESAVRFSDCGSTEEFIDLAGVSIDVSEDEDEFTVTRADTGESFTLSTEEAEIMVGAELYDVNDESKADALERVLDFMPRIRDYSDAQITEEAVFRYLPHDEDARAFRYAEELREASEGLRYLGADASGVRLFETYRAVRGDIYEDGSYEDDDVEEPGVYDYAFAIRDEYGIRCAEEVYETDPRTGDEVGYTTMSTGQKGTDGYREFSFHRRFPQPYGVQPYTDILGESVMDLGQVFDDYGSIDFDATDDRASERTPHDIDFAVAREQVGDEERRLSEWRGVAQRFFSEG